MKLSHNEAMVYEYLLRFNRPPRVEHFVSPTKIGDDIRRGGSMWASPVCLRLVAKGLIERNDKGHYRATKGE